MVENQCVVYQVTNNIPGKNFDLNQNEILTLTLIIVLTLIKSCFKNFCLFFVFLEMFLFCGGDGFPYLTNIEKKT